MTEHELQELERFANALRTHPGSMAHALAAWDDTALQLRLSVDRLGLVRLRMCKTPHSRRGLEQVATYTGANPDALAQLLADGADGSAL